MRAAGDGDVTGTTAGSPDMAAKSFSITGTMFYALRTSLRNRGCAGPACKSRGQVIGYVGQSGRATGPHLHYEVRIHKVVVNPHKYMRTTFEQAVGTGPSAHRKQITQSNFNLGGSHSGAASALWLQSWWAMWDFYGGFGVVWKEDGQPARVEDKVAVGLGLKN